MNPEIVSRLIDASRLHHGRPEALLEAMQRLLFADGDGVVAALDHPQPEVLRPLFVVGGLKLPEGARERHRLIQSLLALSGLSQRVEAIGARSFEVPGAWRPGAPPLAGLLLSEPGGSGRVRARALLLAAPERIEALAPLHGLLTLLVRDAMNHQALHRSQRLEALAATVRPTHPELVGVVHALQDIFAVDGVSLWLDELRARGVVPRVRLCASTVPELMDRPRYYKELEGITGWVFRRARSAILFDRLDRDELFALTGERGREAPIHAEWSEDEHHLQVLMVPLRAGGARGSRCVGVLRLSRRDGRTHFTAADEGSAQSFADLLGAVLHGAVDAQVQRALMQSQHELIALSRQFVEDGRRVHRIVAYNRGMRELIGRKMQGIRPQEVYAPGERKDLHARVKALRAPEAKAAEPCDVRLVGRDAEAPAVVEQTLHRFTDDRFGADGTEYLVLLGRDVTEAREERSQRDSLLRLCDDLGVAFFQSELTGRTLFATPTQERFLGWAEDEPRDRRTLYRDPVERDRIVEQLRERRRQALAEGRKETDAEPMIVFSDLRHKDGHYVLVHCILRVVSHPQRGEVVEGVYLAAAKLQALVKELGLNAEDVGDWEALAGRFTEALRHNEDFLADSAHQMVGPLAGLLGRLKVRFPDGQDGVSAEGQKLIGNAESVLYLCECLILLERLREKEPMARERVSLARTGRLVAEDLQELAQQRRVKLAVDAQSLAQLSVISEKSLVSQMLWCLVHNALSYAFEDTTVEVFSSPEEGGGRALRVADIGLPVSDAERARIWDRRFRGKRAKAQRPAGTGLGLDLVKRIAESQGWRVSVESVPLETGARVCFGVHFPKESV